MALVVSLIMGFTNWVGAMLVTRDSTALLCHLVLQPSVDEYMGMTKRSPSPPEACRSQLLPDWWVQQPNAGECGVHMPAFRYFMLWSGGEGTCHC